MLPVVTDNYIYKTFFFHFHISTVETAINSPGIGAAPPPVQLVDTPHLEGCIDTQLSASSLMG